VSDRFVLATTPLDGVHLIQRKPIGDSRGFLERLYSIEDLQPLIGERSFVQINRTFTATRGTVRGLHFQRPPYAEMKLVTCLRGEVFDVAVDIREGSSTFLHWYGQVLSGANHRSLLIAEGFAHGFQTLTDDCEMLYLHSVSYRPDSEGGLRPGDPRIGIGWPLAIGELSSRDQAHPMVTSAFKGVKL
jgi:dTDP-4-dehydrorhamnose 3,5-epimerase